MKEIKHLLRKAYLEKLAGLTYLNQAIPVDQDYLNVPPAILPIGNSTQVLAHVIFQNQTVNDSSLKCSINQETSLQLDVVTQFNANSGNSAHAELITQEIFDLLFTSDQQRLSFPIPGLNVWRAWLESSRQLSEETKDIRIFRNILIFNHSVQQVEEEPPMLVWNDSDVWNDTLIWND